MIQSNEGGPSGRYFASTKSARRRSAAAARPRTTVMSKLVSRSSDGGFGAGGAVGGVPGRGGGALGATPACGGGGGAEAGVETGAELTAWLDGGGDSVGRSAVPVSAAPPPFVEPWL
jgi:hypothetical protein